MEKTTKLFTCPETLIWTDFDATVKLIRAAFPDEESYLWFYTEMVGAKRDIGFRVMEWNEPERTAVDLWLVDMTVVFCEYEYGDGNTNSRYYIELDNWRRVDLNSVQGY